MTAGAIELTVAINLILIGNAHHLTATERERESCGTLLTRVYHNICWRRFGVSKKSEIDLTIIIRSCAVLCIVQYCGITVHSTSQSPDRICLLINLT